MNQKNISSQFLFMVLAMVLAMVFSACTKKTTEPVAVVAKPVTIEQLQANVNSTPSYPNYIELGMALATANRGAEALQAYSKAKEINPEAPLAWNNICAELNRQQLYVDAIESCEKAIALDPTFVLAQNNLNNSKEQIELLKKDLQPKRANILATKDADAQECINVGMGFYRLKDYKASVEVWSKVKSNDKLFATALNNLASSYIVMKKFNEADKALNKALQLEPENQTFMNNKKWLADARAAK